MKVEIWSDIVCPWCYIGKVRFERALEGSDHASEVEVTYRSFQLDPTIPRGEVRDVVSDLARRKGISEDQVRELMSSVEDAAAAEGLEYHLPQAKAGNTVDAHRVLHLARDRGLQSDVLTQLYRAHFTELRSIFDTASLAEIASEAGLDRGEVEEMLRSDSYRDAVVADEQLARSLGISGVPFFVIDRKYGISGAQKAELIRQSLEQAWAESHPLVTTGADGEVCEDGVCL